MGFAVLKWGRGVGKITAVFEQAESMNRDEERSIITSNIINIIFKEYIEIYLQLTY